MSDKSELWNICQSPYTVLQFGFGFSYKGVDNAIRAIAHLKNTDEKYKDLFYMYLCSSNNYNTNSHKKYSDDLKNLCNELNISSNITIVEKYQTEEMINLYIRLAKLAIFPYIINKDNEVFGASGAIRIVMANNKPVIASNSHLFDDLDGVVPRPNNYIELAKEIDKIFSNEFYKKEILKKSFDFVENNTWEKISDKYLDVFRSIRDR